MRFHHTVIAALALTTGTSLLPSTEALTNGLYLPSYLCGPAVANPTTGVITGADTPMVYPKALAGVLAQFSEFSVAVEGAAYKAAIDPKLWVAVMHAANTQAGLTPFGGTAPFAESLVNNVPALDTPAAMNAQAIMTAAQTNILHVGKQLVAAVAADQTAQAAALKACPIPLENVIPASTGTTITPNQVVTLTLQSQNNVLGAAKGTTAQNLAQFANQVNNGVNPAVLDGAIVYAQDVNNNRVGHFTATGPNMAVWPACGADRNGVVQKQLLSPCTNSYTGPQFFLPFDFTWKLKNGAIVNGGATTITFMGAAVSDNGFGYHQTPWQVQPLADFPVDIAAINVADLKSCVKVTLANSLACAASCFDCVIQGGSTAKVSAANTAKFWCNAVAGTGNPAQGQAAVWSATCTVNGKAATIVPAGTLPVAKPTTKDATTGADMPLSADQQALVDQMNQQFVAMMNGTDTTTCTNTNANAQGNQVNTAATTSHTTWFSTITITLGAIVASLRQ